MKIHKASRQSTPIKLAIQGPSGSGKTMSALYLAKGLVEDWSDIIVIDTENGSSNLYAHLGDFSVLHLKEPFGPEDYIEAIDSCIGHGSKAIVIDSISHEWEGKGGILDIHSNMVGNSFTNWSKVTPRHNAFVQKMLQTNAHIICTVRTKQDYVLAEKNGKMVPEKVGLKGITRDGIDYEFTIVFDVNIKHFVNCSKDRTGLFMDKPEFQMSENTGKKIKAWCGSAESTPKIRLSLQQCDTIQELTQLYQELGDEAVLNQGAFTQRKNELLTLSQNGTFK